MYLFDGIQLCRRKMRLPTNGVTEPTRGSETQPRRSITSPILWLAMHLPYLERAALFEQPKIVMKLSHLAGRRIVLRQSGKFIR